jgi:hypothetical protein
LCFSLSETLNAVQLARQTFVIFQFVIQGRMLHLFQIDVQCKYRPPELETSGYTTDSSLIWGLGSFLDEVSGGDPFFRGLIHRCRRKKRRYRYSLMDLWNWQKKELLI